MGNIDMLYFCTYFDIHYLARALAMYNSLLRHSGPFHLYMVCFDEASVHEVRRRNLAHATAIPSEELERADERLKATKATRTRLEYYYTCGPSIPLYVLENNPGINLITSLDADLFFYHNPQPLIDELEGHSVGMTFHRFPEFGNPPRFGMYNVGWLSFRRDTNGMACLRWWRDQCITWCYERFEGDKYADQKYLEHWPRLFDGVKVLQHRGANVAGWNVRDCVFALQDKTVMVSGYPLIFYHFHGFKQITRNIYNTNLGLTFRFPPRILKERVFLPYIAELGRHAAGGSATMSIRRKRLRSPWVQAVRTAVRTAIGLAFRQYVVVFKDRVY